MLMLTLKLIVSGNANNSANDSLSYFNSNNSVGNANSNVSLLYEIFTTLTTLPLGKK